MAISFTPVALQDKTSILRPIGAEFAAIGTSANSMAGKTIYVDIEAFVNTGASQPIITEVPKNGYSLPFPGIGTATKMVKSPGSFFFLWENGNVKFQKNSNTSFTITLEALMTMDLEGVSKTGGVDTIQRLTKNARSNPSRLNNNSPAVYNQTKALRIIMVVADSSDNVIEYGYLDIPFSSRWFGPYEFVNFDYAFYGPAQLGVAPGFSLNVNKTIRFYCTGTWTAGCCILIWKDTGNQNANNYMLDTNLSQAYFNQAGVLSQVFDFDDSAFVSAGAVTTISGTSKFIDILFDKDYFEKDAVYRVAFMPFKTNDYSNTFITDQLNVTDYVVATSGDITDIIENYSELANPFNKCCSGVAIRERLRFQVYMDKASYNDNIVINESFGTFNDNYLGVKFYLNDYAIPDGNSFNPNDGELITDVGFVNTSDLAGIITTIAMRPEWANTIKYLTAVFQFRILNETETQSTIDEIYYQISFLIPDYITENDEIELVSIKSLETGEDIDKICGDTGIIQLLFKNLTAKTYSLLGYLYGEYDTYKDGAHAFVKINNSVGIFNMSPTFAGEDLAQVNIDTGKLPYGVASCFELIGVNSEHIEGECPTSADITVTLTYESGLNISVSYSGLTEDPKQVEIRLHPLTDKPVLGGDKEFAFFETSGDTGVFLGYGHGFIKAYNINVVVKTLNNCYLSGNANFQVSTDSLTHTQTLTLL